MILLNEYELSRWAYIQCCKGNDTPELRKLITRSEYAFYYCLSKNDNPEMSSKITDYAYLKLYHDYKKRMGKK